MANEFDLLSNGGFSRVSLWKCKQCQLQIEAVGKPRSHKCLSFNVRQPGTGSSNRRLQNPFSQGLTRTPVPFTNPTPSTPPFNAPSVEVQPSTSTPRQYEPEQLSSSLPPNIANNPYIPPITQRQQELHRNQHNSGASHESRAENFHQNDYQNQFQQ